jgi:hypothetical protein
MLEQIVITHTREEDESKRERERERVGEIVFFVIE